MAGSRERYSTSAIPPAVPLRARRVVAVTERRTRAQGFVLGADQRGRPQPVLEVGVVNSTITSPCPVRAGRRV